MASDLATIDRITPPPLWERFEEMCRARADVRTLRYILGTREKMLEWVHSIGVASDAGLAAHVPPLPPEELRQIVAAPTPEEFLWTGFVDFQTVVAQHALHGRSAGSDVPSILDFGCGCGRLLRFFAMGRGAWRAVGCDVNRSHVEWCKQALAGVEVVPNDARPPLPFSNESFDCIHSVSIFTHLNEDGAHAWLSECARLLRPGGVLVATTHGLPAAQIIRGSKLHQTLFGVDEAGADALVRSLESEGFVFWPYDRDVVERARAGDEYGNAFVHPRRVRDVWTPARLELCDHVAGGLRGWQDVAVWRKLGP